MSDRSHSPVLVALGAALVTIAVLGLSLILRRPSNTDRGPEAALSPDQQSAGETRSVTVTRGELPDTLADPPGPLAPPGNPFGGDLLDEEVIASGYVLVRLTSGQEPVGDQALDLVTPTGRHRSQRTRPDGFALFAECPDDYYTVETEWNGADVREEVRSGVLTEIDLPARWSKVQVLVRDDRGTPAAGCTVTAIEWFEGGTRNTRARTDESGRVEMGVPRFPVMIHAMDEVSADHQLLEAPTEDVVVLTLPAGMPVRGRLVDTGGLPTRDATIRSGPQGSPTISVAADGSFDLLGAPDGVTGVVVSTPGSGEWLVLFANAMERALAEGRSVVDLGDITLPRTTGFTIEVLTDTGDPVRDARVSLIREEMPPDAKTTAAGVSIYPVPRSHVVGSTDAEGRVTLALPRAKHLGSCAGAGIERTGFHVDPRAGDFLRITVRAGHRLTVILDGPPEQLEAGEMRLTVRDLVQPDVPGDKSTTLTRTALDTWVAYGLGDGEFELTGRSDRFVSPCERFRIEGRDVDLRIPLELGEVVSGRVLFEARPVPYAQVIVKIPETTLRWSEFAGEDGRFSLSGVPAWDARCTILAIGQVEIDGRRRKLQSERRQLGGVLRWELPLVLDERRQVDRREDGPR